PHGRGDAGAEDLVAGRPRGRRGGVGRGVARRRRVGPAAEEAREFRPEFVAPHLDRLFSCAPGIAEPGARRSSARPAGATTPRPPSLPIIPGCPEAPPTDLQTLLDSSAS